MDQDSDVPRGQFTVSPGEWHARRRPLDRVYFRQQLISAAFGAVFISLEDAFEALTAIYRAELGSNEAAAKKLEVDPSTIYRRMKEKWGYD